ncbi:MAG: hypothetical protein PVSMB7_30350 [Chloroflexota bacterium]
MEGRLRGSQHDALERQNPIQTDRVHQWLITAQVANIGAATTPSALWFRHVYHTTELEKHNGNSLCRATSETESISVASGAHCELNSRIHR